MYSVSSSTFSGFYPTVERPKKLAKSGLVYLWSCSSPGRRRNSKYHAIHWRGPRSNYLDYNGIVVYLLLLHSSTGFGSMGKVSRNKPTFIYIYILTYLHVGSTLVHFPQLLHKNITNLLCILSSTIQKCDTKYWKSLCHFDPYLPYLSKWRIL